MLKKNKKIAAIICISLMVANHAVQAKSIPTAMLEVAGKLIEKEKITKKVNITNSKIKTKVTSKESIHLKSNLGNQIVGEDITIQSSEVNADVKVNEDWSLGSNYGNQVGYN